MDVSVKIQIACCIVGIAACLVAMLAVAAEPGHRADGCWLKSPGHLRDENKRFWRRKLKRKKSK